MGNTPLKLEGSSGDLKEMTTAEENYLAYQAGLYLADLTSASVAMLTTTSGGTSIGSFSDTFYNQAVGSHPGTSLTIGTTTTTLYQNTGTISETGIVRPLIWDDTLSGIQQADDTDWNACIQRLLITIFSNQYPGTLRLASSAPSGDYSAIVSNVFSDTQADGTTVNYSIYQRDTMTAPTAARPVKLESTSPIAFKQMTDAEIKTNFGKRVANRIMSSTNYIGAYQLRSSAQGAPTAPGSWAARGTATDTRKTTADVDYTRNSTTDFSADYTRNSTTDFTGDFTGDFVGDFAGNFTGDFIGNTNFTRNSTRISQRTSYRTCYRIQFGGYSYVHYPGQAWFIPSPSPGFYSSNFAFYFLGNFLGNFTGDFVGDFVGTRNYTRISTRNSTTNFTRNSTTIFTGDFLGNYIGNYVGDFVGNYLGETIQSSAATVETYTLYVRIS